MPNARWFFQLIFSILISHKFRESGTDGNQDLIQKIIFIFNEFFDIDRGWDGPYFVAKLEFPSLSPNIKNGVY